MSALTSERHDLGLGVISGSNIFNLAVTAIVIAQRL
jgi:Ca2+/Na+ antiporter